MNESRKIILEIVCGNIDSALEAQRGKADRIELCANLSEGGTTPAYGTITEVRRIFSAAIHVIIRPRGGDFLYSKEEFSAMKEDIRICKDLGVDGIVLGILLPGGQVDVERTIELVGFSNPFPVTFHRAFDVAKDPVKSLEDIILAGCKRLLTSGQSDSAIHGAQLISELISVAGNRIVIMPGGGINEDNVLQLLKVTRAKEIHASCKSSVNSQMFYRNTAVRMGSADDQGEYSVYVSDAEKIRSLRKNADSFLAEKNS